MKRRVRIVAVALSAAVCGCEDNRGPGPPPVPVGRAAPTIEVTLLDGRKLASAELTGKYVLLDFWATWCLPCLQELPNVRKVHERMKDRPNFVMISISLDDDKRTLERFLRKNRMEWPQAFVHDGGNMELVRMFQVVGIPATFLLGPDGALLTSDLWGPSMADAIEKRVKPPVAAPTSAPAAKPVRR